MGSAKSRNSIASQDGYKSVYRLKPKDTAVMKKVWQIVEYDLSYYGAIFSTILFHNHPQYMKYFQEDNIPEFVQDARIKKKFSAVCSVVSALFIDYSKKRRQRDYLLGYIAMIHKDMQLSSQDMENFMMDLLEMLIQELPEEMSAECTVVHMKYFNGLLQRIGYFMHLQRQKDFELLETYERPPKSEKFCGWLSLGDPPSIYGKPLEHWMSKRSFWQTKTAFWASIDMETSGMSSFLSMEKNNPNKSKRHYEKCSTELSPNDDGINPWLKPIEHYQALTSTSRSDSAEKIRKSTDRPSLAENVKNSRSSKCSWYEKYKKTKKHRSTKSAIARPSRPMETIREDQPKGSIRPAPKKASKAQPKRTDIKETTKIHNETDERISSQLAIENKNLVIDAGRARKRRRDKRNVVHPGGAGFAIYEENHRQNKY